MAVVKLFFRFQNHQMFGGGKCYLLLSGFGKVCTSVPKKITSVVYTGSHHWTERDLSATAPSNAEVSTRIEVYYSPEHIADGGDSSPSQLNRHLLHANRMPACIEATEANRGLFEQWTQTRYNRLNTAEATQTKVAPVRLDSRSPHR